MQNCLTIPDHMPSGEGEYVDAIAVHSYCLTWDKTRLTEPNRACIARAIELKSELVAGGRLLSFAALA